MLNAGLVIALSRTRKKTFNRDFIPPSSFSDFISSCLSFCVINSNIKVIADNENNRFQVVICLTVGCAWSNHLLNYLMSFSNLVRRWEVILIYTTHDNTVNDLDIICLCGFKLVLTICSRSLYKQIYSCLARHSNTCLCWFIGTQMFESSQKNCA